MAPAHLLLAEAHHLAGDSTVALSKVADLLQRNPNNLPGHMLLTRIHLSHVSRHTNQGHHCLYGSLHHFLHYSGAWAIKHKFCFNMQGATRYVNALSVVRMQDNVK